jgi:hypothetical protein
LFERHLLQRRAGAVDAGKRKIFPVLCLRVQDFYCWSPQGAWGLDADAERRRPGASRIKGSNLKKLIFVNKKTKVMNSVEELQNTLSRLIFSVRDFRVLREIKQAVEAVLPDSPDEQVVKAPWVGHELQVRAMPSFGEVVRAQGHRQLLFAELLPHIDDTPTDYTLDDLLTALN